MAALEVTEDQARTDAVRLSLRGELDLASAYAFDRRLLAVEARQPSVIVVDLRELTMLDSAGLARLIAGQRRARKGGWRFVLIKGGRIVQRVLQVSGMVDRLEITSDPEAALAGPARVPVRSAGLHPG
jgi:anti-anti-sigma factor